MPAAAVSEASGTRWKPLLAGGITISKEDKALSKLSPQAGAASREGRKPRLIGDTALHSTSKKGEKAWVPTLRLLLAQGAVQPNVKAP